MFISLRIICISSGQQTHYLYTQKWYTGSKISLFLLQCKIIWSLTQLIQNLSSVEWPMKRRRQLSSLENTQVDGTDLYDCFHFFWNLKNLNPCPVFPPPDDIGGSNWGRPSRSNIFQFHALFRKKNSQNNRLAPPPMCYPPHLRLGNPGSATAKHDNLAPPDNDSKPDWT